MPEVVDYDEVARAQEAADEIRDPGCTARKAAARERERIVREARATTKSQYRNLLTIIARGEQPDPVELTRLATALGRSEADIAADAEEREAELADADEVERCRTEKAALEDRIAEQAAIVTKGEAEKVEATEKAKNLEAEIWKLCEPVGLKQKTALAKARAKEHAAAASIQQATDQIHLLQSRLQNTLPRCNHVERLRQARFRARHEAAARESDRAMAPYVFAQQQDSLPDDVMASVISPKADPPSQRPGETIRVGTLNGEPVEIRVGKLA